MKATLIKKFNIVLSLWMIAIIATLVVFGYKLGVYGFYVAASVVCLVLLSINVLTVISGLISTRGSSLKTREQYNKF